MVVPPSGCVFRHLFVFLLRMCFASIALLPKVKMLVGQEDAGAHDASKESRIKLEAQRLFAMRLHS